MIVQYHILLFKFYGFHIWRSPFPKLPALIALKDFKAKSAANPKPGLTIESPYYNKERYLWVLLFFITGKD